MVSVLVVDDEVDTCKNLSDIMTDLGYEVDIAHDGFQALDMVRQKRYDVALLDLKMPGMDGITLYRKIREIQSSAVAMIVTAFAENETIAQALEAGAWKVLAKPVEFPYLFSLVEAALGQPLVLIIDDDAELCRNLWDILRDRGYRVDVAHDAEEAAKRLNQKDHRVVLLDMKLPGSNGAELFQLVRKTIPEARTMVITGFRAETEDLVQNVLEEGADAVCYKPFDIPRLLATLEKLITDKSDH